MKKRQPIELHLVPGKDALKFEHIVSLFEKLKGRKATDEERQECIDQLAAIKLRETRTSR